MNKDDIARFGVIDLNSLKPEIADQLYRNAENYTEEKLHRDWTAELKKKYPEESRDDAIYRVVLRRLAAYFEDPLENGGLVGHFKMLNLANLTNEIAFEYQLSCLSGIILIVTKSPFISNTRLCSPCVPNAGDLDNLCEDGYETYDVPKEWRR